MSDHEHDQYENHSVTEPDGTERLRPLEEVEPACEVVNRQLPSHGWVPIVALISTAFAIFLGAAYLYSMHSTQQDESTAARAFRNTERIEAGLLGSCRRLQLQRERSNLSEARQYLFFRTAGHNPKNPQRVRAQYDAFATTTEYGPPTDCPEAVTRPLTYKAPMFILYARLPIGYPIAIITAPKIGRGGRRQPTYKEWRDHRGWWHRQAVKTGVLP